MEEQVCDAICQEWYPFLRVVFHLEPFWAILPSNPLESTRITIFESGNIGTFVRAESASIETGLKT